jgi:Kef-type K+ transport system membrane component KefB
LKTREIFFRIFVSAGLSASGPLSALSRFLQVGRAVLFCAVLLLLAKLSPALIDKILGIRRKELLLLAFFGIVLLVTALSERWAVQRHWAPFSSA